MQPRRIRGLIGCLIGLFVLNLGSAATATLEVAPPTPLITAAPPSQSASASATFEFTSGGAASFLCRLDGGAYSACTSPKAYTGLTDNAHVFEVKAVSGVDESAAAAYIWRVDVPPTAALQQQQIGTFVNPMFVTAPPDDPSRVFVVERAGRIMLVKDGVKQTTPFLDISADVSTTGERGLFSIAFAPDYPVTGRFYVFYTRSTAAGSVGDEVLQEVQRSAVSPDLADPTTRRTVLVQEHSNDAYHNGGQLQFGPDGYLYISLGDGFDNPDEAQNLNTWLGKILRIDPRQSGPNPYSVPPDNPFVGVAGLDEIYLYGLRNPWRFSFDRNTGDLIPTDVGESTREEVDYFTPNTTGSGANLGWPCYEGSLVFDNTCPPITHTPPVLQKNHGSDSFCAITGGYVVRDVSLGIYGRYLYGDYCQNNMRTAALRLPTVTDDQPAGISLFSLDSFGEDACGRVYTMELAGSASRVFRLEQPDQAPCQPPSLSVADIALTEGNSGTKDATFTVTLSSARAVPVTVEYATEDATATAGADYQTRTGTLTFAPGERRKSVAVPVVGDTTGEPTETFRLVLSRAGNAALADAVGVATVTDNDLPSLSISDVSVAEGNVGTTPVSFTVTLSSSTGSTVTANWTTAAGTATAGTDYQTAGGTVTFPPGDTSESVSVNVVGDVLNEPNETFFVNLSGPTNATIADGQGTGTILNDDGANNAPNAVNDTLTTPEDVAGSLNVLTNDSDPDGDPLTVSAYTQGTNGTVSCTSGGTCTYTGNANFNGSDSFTYTANDGKSGTGTATVNVTVTSVNDAPHPHDDFPTTNEDAAVTFDVLENEVGHDDDGGTVAFSSIVAQPPRGSVTCTAAGICTYTPIANLNGLDQFDYRVSDGQGGLATATVFVTVNSVNDAPVAADQSQTTAEDTAKALTLAATDVDGDALTYTIVTPPTNGSLSGSGANRTYTPAANYNGPDSFVFRASDGALNDTGTVSIAVTSVNDAPVAADQSQTTAEDTSKAITLAATDVDGDALMYTIVTPPTNGSLSGSGANRTYTPAANYNGPDSFVFRASDGALNDTGTVSIAVTSVNDAPVAADQSQTTAEDTAKALTLAATDVDGDALTYTIVTPPTNGSLSGSGANRTYTPAANYNGPDSFVFSASDGTVSDTGAVSITVTAVNDAPVAADQSQTTAEDTAKAITLAATDVDGDALTYTITDPPDNGILSGSGTNHTYTPNTNYNGPDSFVFTASDGVASDTGTVSLTVTAVNDPPVAQDGTASTAEDTPANITLQASDVDGDALTYSITAPPDNGAVNCTGASCTYTPATNYTGPDAFTFQASDGVAADSGTISISVVEPGVIPDAQDSSVSTAEDTPVAVTLQAIESEGDPITYTILDPPDQGTLSGTGANRTYSPAANYNGPDSFVFEARDEDGADTATVFITVTAVNDAPVAADQSQTTAEDTAKALTLAATDVDGDALTYTIVTPPTNGSLSGSGANRTYTPAANYNGPDSFVFSASDGTVSDTGAVSLTVTPVNDAPVLDPSGNPTFTPVDKNETNPQGDLVRDLLTTGANGDPITDVDAGALEGIAVVSADSANGVWEYRTTAAGPWVPVGAVSSNSARLLFANANVKLRFVPAPGFDGGAQLQFRAWDRTTGSNGALADPGVGGGTTAFSTAVEIATLDVGDNQVPVATDATITTVEDTAKAITLAATDPDGDVITYSITDPPDHGTLSGSGADRTYTPAENYNGPDSFVFSASDGAAFDAATVSITVTPRNDPPTAVDDTLATLEGTAAVVNVLANDSDVDGDALGVTVLTPGAHGTVGCGGGGLCTYTPSLGFSGTDAFAYTVFDGSGGTDTGAVAVTVSAIARPAIRIDPVSVVEGNTGTVDAVFAVSLSFPAPLAASVRYETVDVTAKGGTDYVAATDVLRFSPGEVSKLVAVDVRGDLADEPNETLALRLSEPVNMTLAVGEAIGTIVDDDQALVGPAVVVPAGTLRASAAGVVQMPVKAPAGAKGTVVGRVTLDALVDAPSLATRTAIQKMRRVRLGRTTFRLRPGQSRTIRLRLSTAGRKLLRKRGRLRVQAVVAARDATGKTRTTRRTLVLRAAKRKP